MGAAGADADCSAQRRQVVLLREVRRLLQLASADWTRGKLNQAVTRLEHALSLAPNHAEVHNNLGMVRMMQGKVNHSIAHYKQALAIEPNAAVSHYNMGVALWAEGKVGEAAKHFARVLTLQPDHVVAHSNLLYAYNYTSGHDLAAVHHAHRDFARRWETPLAARVRPLANDRSLDRRLRVGYVSSDFRQHSVAHFIAPVLAHHDRERFEIFCYFNHPQEDELTKRIRGHVDHWRCIFQLSDDQVAQQIRTDQVDILIDLNGHTAHNRLLVFARRSAPIQITWLGYPNTTGLSAMDYRLVDGYTDPVGMTEHLHSERLWRLPDCFSCYQPPMESPEVSELPTRENACITFGSFNNLAKITPAVMGLWARILHAVPGSRLVLKNINLSEHAVQKSVRQAFAGLGIGQDFLELAGFEPSPNAHLQCYQNVDIGLDPFPYNGTTTTCEALWMGVPVITLAGQIHAGRVGVSLLRNLDLAELIAETQEDYIAIALRLAADQQHLSTLRQNLRPRMAASPLMDAPRFTKNLEHMYRLVWED